MRARICALRAGSSRAPFERFVTTHPGATALFLILCGADQNPNPRSTVDLARQHGSTLAGEVEKVIASPMTVVSGPVTGTNLTGSRAGQTFTIESFPVLTGRIALDRKSLTLATEEPTVEVVTFSNGDVHYRICHRSRILLKLRQAED